MNTKSTKQPENVRKLTKKENIIFISFLIITIATIFFAGFLMAIAIGFLLFIVFGFISKKEIAKEVETKEEEIKITEGWYDFKYPELQSLELSIQEGLTNQENKNISINLTGFDKERWEYLKSKYPQLSLPITNTLHKNHSLYKNKYLKIKDKIISGDRVCLNESEEKYILEFCSEDNLSLLNVVRPIIINTYLAAIRYYDYSKKAVKEILDNEPNQFLNVELEPTNKFDEFAVKLLLEKYLIGYIPREYSKQVFNAISNNNEIYVYIEEYNKREKLEERIQIEIEIREK